MGIVRAALVIMTGNVASRVLGFVREIVIAGLFGATAATDAFRTASRIPTSIYDLLVGGLVSAALVPVLSEYADDDREAFSRIASILASLIAVILTPVSLLMVFLAPWLIGLYAPAMAPDTAELATLMLQVMLPALVFQGLAGLLTALHYARQQFTYPAVSISAFNLGIILAALLLVGVLGPISLVVGVVLGAVSQAVLLFVTLKGVRFRVSLTARHPAVRRILLLAAPVAVGLVVDIFARLVDTALATSTGVGNLAALQFATTIVQFPLGLIAAAVSFAILPALSRYALPDLTGENTPVEAEEGLAVTAGPAVADDEFQRTLGLGIKLVMLAIIPATILLVVLRVPVVQLLFQRGQFDVLATEKTALAFLAYAPGLVAAAIDQLLIFAFYARRNTIIPVAVGIGSIGVYFVVAFSLVGPLGFAGLALANSAQWIAHSVVLALLLSRALGGLGKLAVTATSLKAIAAGAAMALVIALLARALGLDVAGQFGFVAALLQTLAVALVGLGVYAAGLALLRTTEVLTVAGLVRQRLAARRTAA